MVVRSLRTMVAGGLTCLAATTYLYYFSVQRNTVDSDAPTVQLAALALSGEMVDRTLTDAEIQEKLIVFGLDLLKHPPLVRALKDFVVMECTEDTPTRAALKQFAVRDVIQDAWVKDELFQVVGELKRTALRDPAIYPRPVLSWLGNAAVDGLRRPLFQEELLRTVRWVLWQSLLAAPPPAQTSPYPWVERFIPLR